MDVRGTVGTVSVSDITSCPGGGAGARAAGHLSGFTSSSGGNFLQEGNPRYFHRWRLGEFALLALL